VAPRMSIGVNVLWYDASNLNNLPNQAAHNLGICKSNEIGTASCRNGIGGDWVDVFLQWRYIFWNSPPELENLPTSPFGGPGDDSETIALRRTEAVQLNSAIAAMSPDFREVIVLREIEGLSYKEIAAVIDSPIGTVMSRLARARAELRRLLKRSQCIQGGH